MAETKVKDGNFITIQSFMVKDLKLKGNELLIYAIIFGFSQDGEQRFTGSQQYLADWTNSTRQGVNKVLKSLVEKGYIYKIDNLVNGVKFCEYGAKFPITNKTQQVETEFTGDVNKVDRGSKQSLQGGSKQSLHNNIALNNIDNNIEHKEKERKKTRYDEILATVDDEELRELFYEYIKMRKMIKAPMTDRALQMLIKKVYDLESTVSRQKELLSNAIMNNWKSIYPLKDIKKVPNTQGGNVFLDIAREEGMF